MTKSTQEHRMTDNAGRRTRVLGSLRSADGTGVVRIEDRYDTDIDDLWSALTDPRRLARWYGEVEGDLRRGGQFNVYLEAAGLHGVGRVDVCEPPRRLQVVTRETEGGRSTPKIWPPTSPGASPATPRRGGTSSSLPTRSWQQPSASTAPASGSDAWVELHLCGRR